MYGLNNFSELCRQNECNIRIYLMWFEKIVEHSSTANINNDACGGAHPHLEKKYFFVFLVLRVPSFHRLDN